MFYLPRRKKWTFYLQPRTIEKIWMFIEGMAQKSRTAKKVYKQFLISPAILEKQSNLQQPRLSTTNESSSNNNQCFLEIKPGEDYQRCIWCINSASQKDKERNSFFTTRERPTPSSSEAKWRCNFKDRRVGIRELCGDECLDFLMPVQNQVSNNIDSLERSNVAMQKLPSLPELVDAVRNNCGFHKFHESKLKYKSGNKDYFNDEYGVNNIINPLIIDNYGMTVLFVDDRGILFEWCELTRSMYVLGINEMEGLANFFYHPEKKLTIMEDTGEMIPDVELEGVGKS